MNHSELKPKNIETKPGIKCSICIIKEKRISESNLIPSSPVFFISVGIDQRDHVS